MPPVWFKRVPGSFLTLLEYAVGPRRLQTLFLFTGFKPPRHRLRVLLWSCVWCVCEEVQRGRASDPNCCRCFNTSSSILFSLLCSLSLSTSPGFSTSYSCHYLLQRESTLYLHLRQMSLAAGPGRGGGSSQLPDELKLVTEKHVTYIQSLDTVCPHLTIPFRNPEADTDGPVAQGRARISSYRASPHQWHLLGSRVSPPPRPSKRAAA